MARVEVVMARVEVGAGQLVFPQKRLFVDICWGKCRFFGVEQRFFRGFPACLWDSACRCFDSRPLPCFVFEKDFPDF